MTVEPLQNQHMKPVSLLVGVMSLCSIASLIAAESAAPAPAPATPAKAKEPTYVEKMAAGLTPARQVVYKKAGDRELHLHVFEPQGHKATDKRACYVVIHGGGWTGGTPSRMYPLADHYAKRGLLGISVEYRLIGKPAGTTPFDCAKDGRSAIRYIRAHAGELGIDPHKIIVSGGSAGGHVAAATALFAGVDEADEDLTPSPVPNALVLLYPVIDTSTEGYGNAKCGPQWKDISPLHRVTGGAPPTIVFHGTGDTVTPFKGAKAFHEAMQAAGNRCELVVNEGGVHGFLMRTEPLYEEAMKKTDEFLITLGFLGKN
jgi:acetyl esterase/lipase